jgi:hypothetical protein
MYLEGTLISVDFSDLLAETLPRNRQFFDHLIIATSPQDKDTQKLAKKYNCTLVISERQWEDNAPFNKGKIINDAFKKLHKKDRIIHLDCDIVLPAEFRRQVLKNTQRYSKRAIFGCHRYMVPSKKQWDHFLNTGRYKWRIDKKRVFPQAPAGFVQIWHSEFHRNYPENYPTASRSDIVFGNLFYPRIHFNLYVYHLATHRKVTTDHKGRKSNKWE